MVESAPSSHRYFSISVQPSDQRKFSSALKKEVRVSEFIKSALGKEDVNAQVHEKHRSINSIIEEIYTIVTLL